MMRSICLLFVLGLVGCTFAYSDHISKLGKSVFKGYSLTDTPCTGLYSCSSCSESMVCRPVGPGKWELVRKVPCTGATPFCDYNTGTCTSKEDKDCGDKSDTFICPTQEGHFPDPVDTKLYHVCSNYLPALFTCADALQYNPDNKDCEPVKTLNREVLSCSGDGQKVGFPGYNNYFAYCYSGKALLVDRCIGDFKLNTTSQICEATCQEDGVLRDWEDCTGFFLCSTLYITKTESFTLKSKMQCPAGQGFNPSLYMCSNITDLPDCKGPPSPTSKPTPEPPTKEPPTQSPPPTTTAAPPTDATTKAP